MKNKILLFFLLFVASSGVSIMNAQLKIAENGKVGISLSGTTTPLSTLSIGGEGLENARLYVKNASANAITSDKYGIFSYINLGTVVPTWWQYGIYGQCGGSGGHKVGVYGMAVTTTHVNAPMETYGVYGIAGGANNGKNYGVFGKLQLSASAGAGVFGTNTDTIQVLSYRYAGYFRGRTEVNGVFYCPQQQTTSDARLKTNIRDVKNDAISKLNTLHPIQFQWKQVDDVVTEDTVVIKTPHFSEDMDFNKSHYGLVAQDVQKLFPELVEESGDGYLSVNYIELIPLLIQAVQELSAKVEELGKIDVPRMLRKSDSDKAVLYQNNPNPFSADTKIEYHLPSSTKSATLCIYNLNGSQVAEYPIITFGDGAIIVTASKLEPGMYLYSLIADGQVIDTKRMILTK